jgi:hypothetical protein
LGKAIQIAYKNRAGIGVDGWRIIRVEKSPATSVFNLLAKVSLPLVSQADDTYTAASNTVRLNNVGLLAVSVIFLFRTLPLNFSYFPILKNTLTKNIYPARILGKQQHIPARRQIHSEYPNQNINHE